ncbi:MAG: hypothetical protein M0P61_03445 [Ignavibacteriaceae bacterium]|jgi:hypothetical protein|nr:hypothetical protein [Ignavibacteriaceae bacterium]
MKNLFFASVSLLLLLFIGCSKNNPVEASSPTDSQLKSSIVGTWSNGYITIIYDANGNFQDSVYGVYDSGTKLVELIKGTYEIKSGILTYNVSEWNLINKSDNQTKAFSKIQIGIPNYNSKNILTVKSTTTGFAIASYIPNFKIQIQAKNILHMFPLDILTRTGVDKGDIWGEWTTSEWGIAYDTQLQNHGVLGKVQLKYDFNKDSMNVTYGTKFSKDTSETFNYTTEKIEYNAPNLSWGMYYHKTVEFQDGKMYLYEKLDSLPFPLKKIR